MAHKIAKTADGSDSFVSVKEIPWHNLGKVVDKQMTAAECIKLAGLDYKVCKTDVLAKIGGTTKTVFDNKVTYRSDTGSILGIVGSRYHIVQNKEAFVFFDSIVGKKAAIYETAGALGVGERIFITAKLPKHIKVGKDVIDQYLYLTSTHDGSGAIRAAFTPIRIVCNNTLQMALDMSKRMVSIRHTLNAQRSLEQAHKLMGIVGKQAENLQHSLEHMAKVKVTDPMLRKFIELAMHPNREQIAAGQYEDDFTSRFTNTIDTIHQYALTHPSQLTPETKGTLYGAYNAISGYFQNVKDFKTEEDKMVNIMEGTAARKTSHAMGIALQVISNKIKLQ